MEWFSITNIFEWSFVKEKVMEMANGNEHFVRNISFTDESSFLRHGRHNPSISRYRSRDNQHHAYDSRTQYTHKN